MKEVGENARGAAYMVGEVVACFVAWLSTDWVDLRAGG